MNRRSPFVAAAKVLGLVGCIVLLAYLAARGGEGSHSMREDTANVDDAIVFSTSINVTAFAGQTITVDLPSP